MKLCTFEVHTPLGRHQRLGAIITQGIADMSSVCAWHLARKGEARPYALGDVLVPPDMGLFLHGELTSWTFARKALGDLEASLQDGLRPDGPGGEQLLFEPDTVRLLAPLPRPSSLRHFSSFEGHVRTSFEKVGEPMPEEWYRMPAYSRGNHHTIFGPDDEILWPSFTEEFDYTLELAAVIGRAGKDIREEEASGYIAGFTVMNGFSARDIHRKETKLRLGHAKGTGWGTALGPVLVTPEEVENPYRLAMTARVNGDVWSSGSSEGMHWSFEQMIAYASRDEPLFPGDILGSGAATGGCGLDVDRWLKPGDIIELEIEKIGVLRNRVVRR